MHYFNTSELFCPLLSTLKMLINVLLYVTAVTIFLSVVFEILLAFVKHKNWELAFYEVVPQRKIEASKTSSVGPDPDIDPGSLQSSTATEVQSQVTATGSEDEEAGSGTYNSTNNKERDLDQLHLETTPDTKFEKEAT